MTPEQADSVPPYIEIQRPMNFESGQIKATIDPQRLSVPNVLQRADIFVLKIIAESFKDRPIYFSRTSAGYGNELGLGSYLLTQGLATKVFIPPAVPGRDTLLVPGSGWMDLKRTKTLWDSVFVGTEGAHEAQRLDRSPVGRHPVPLRRDGTDALRSAAGDGRHRGRHARHGRVASHRPGRPPRRPARAAPAAAEPAGPVQNPLLTPTDTTQGQPLKR